MDDKRDIHPAYHHIVLRDSHTDFMGFAWTFLDGNTVYMKFIVSVFGLPTAPCAYSKVTRPLVAKWRSERKKGVMYLDDGFGYIESKDSAQSMASSN